MKRICICGGGSLGHVIAGYLAAKEDVQADILTRRPDEWSHELTTYTPDGKEIASTIGTISNDAAIVGNADIILLCLPGYAIRSELQEIAPHIKQGTFVGSVFSSTGFFFEAMELLPDNIAIWGFQRVPFIARTRCYGKSADILGYKPSYNIAVERCPAQEKEKLRAAIETLFDAPVHLLNSYYEASFTNSNPILHPSRLYSLFGNWDESTYYPRQYLFYEEWDERASELLIAMDRELFAVLAKLPVAPDYLTPILPYYESSDAQSLTAKIRSIQGFKGIRTPMTEHPNGWQPDLTSRYFQEDFMHGLRYIYDTAHKMGVETPTIDRIYKWGEALAQKGRK